ncbi:MAG TPA: aminotransferase class V-fold PLP-dependent enzyme [Noviherbaspirillum sp.]
MTPMQFRSTYFPQLANRVYLAACSLGARSVALDRAMTAMLDAMQQDEPAWSAFEEETQQVRARLAKLIGARVDQIALLPNASVGAYQVVSTLRWDERQALLYSDREFPSIAHVWLAQKARGARPQAIRNAGRHADMAAQYAQRIERGTRFVSIPHTSYLDGKTLPVKQIAACARSAGARVFVDAYQAVGVQAIDVGELDCDYLVGGTMKYLLGLPGLAFLFARDGVGNDLDPQLTGWFGRKWPFDFDAATLDFPNGASRFETGTPSVPSIYAANAGLSLIGDLNPHLVREHVASLIDYASEKLLSQGETLLHIPRRAEHGAHLALADASPAALDACLRKHGIVASPRGNALRLSFHYYNDASDIDFFCEALKRCRKTSTS